MTPRSGKDGVTSRHSLSLASLPMVVLIAVFWGSSADLWNRVSLGPVSVAGAGTLAFAAGSGLLVLLSLPEWGASRSAYVPLPVVLMGVFVFFAILVLFANWDLAGLQNVSVYSGFVASIIIGARLSLRTDLLLAMSWFAIGGAIATGAFLVGQVVGVTTLAPRAYALSMLVPLACASAVARADRRLARSPIWIFVGIAASLSRMATASGLLVLTVLGGRGTGGLFRAVGKALLAVIGFFVLAWAYRPLRERFTVGDAAYDLGGVQLNTSGRAVVWERTLDGASEQWLFGQGPGAAATFVSARFSGISHPHNEYIRLYFDFGVFGLALFVVSVASLTLWLLRRSNDLRSQIHAAAAVALAAVMVASVTDNVLTYPFVMIPLGMLVGLAVGSPAVDLSRQESKVEAKI